MSTRTILVWSFGGALVGYALTRLAGAVLDRWPVMP